MIKRTLGEIAGMIPGAAVEPDLRDLPIAGVGKDTRTLTAGNLYIPLIGDQFDGHDFVRQAVHSGAAASLWQRDHGPAPDGVPIVLVDDALKALQALANAYRRELPVKVIGITGSNGKTSTKDMVHAVLSVNHRVHKTQGNLNNHIGLPLTLLELDQETEYAVVEMGMSGFGEIELLSLIAEPDCAMITNIGEAHMLQLGSREGIAKAKCEITQGLRAGGTLIVNGDDSLLDDALQALEKSNAYKIIRFGLSETNDYYPTDIEVSLTYTAFHACRMQIHEEVKQLLHIPLLGRHNAVNAMSAVAAAELFGVPAASIRQGLERMTPTGMRIETVRTAGGATLLNDAYNASPASMKAAVHLLLELTGVGRKIAVLGDMRELGPDEKQYHREIGRMLNPQDIHAVFTYGELASYIAEACRQTFPQGAVEAFMDKQALIDRLQAFIQPSDLILVKASRGMKLEEVVNALART